MIVRVGQNPSTVALARYGKQLDLLEVKLDNGAPRRRTIETMKSESPGHLVFAVVVPKQIASLEADATEADVTGAIETARALGARWLVVRTPHTARPGVRTRTRLTRLIELLKAAEIAIVWEPAGLLAEADAEELAASLGVTLARDPARDDLPEGAVAYGRISALGTGGRVRSSALERAADRLAGFEEVYVIIEAENAVKAAKELRSLLGALADSAGDEDGEDEDEDDLEDEDDEDEGDESEDEDEDEDDES